MQTENKEVWSEQYSFLKEFILFNLELKERIDKRNLVIVKDMLMVIIEFYEGIDKILNKKVYINYISFIQTFAEFSSKILEEQITEEIWLSLQSTHLYFAKCITEMSVLIKRINSKPRECVCCKNKVIYQSLPMFYEYMNIKNDVIRHIPETLNKEDYSCPKCGSSDRDRLIIMFMEMLGMETWNSTKKVIQFAPAMSIERWIKRTYPNIQYESTDLYMKEATFKSDIQNMKMVPDNHYSLFICSHVLEHVQDDKKAMKELFRILKKDGIGIFLVPLSLDLDKTDEEWGLSEAENWKRFGQDDHCRRYAKKDLVKRLEESGFNVHCLYKDFFGEKFNENGLLETSCLYILTKENFSIEELIEKNRCEKQVENNIEDGPLVSVIMSAYNHENFVERAIESVLSQTYKNIEFLIADDGSPDETAQKISKYEKEVDQIYLFKDNLGGRSDYLRNLAKGKYIAVINSDDYWENQKLELQVKYLEKHPDCAACFTWVDAITETGESYFQYSLFESRNMKKEEWMNYFFENGNCLAHPSVLIRSDIYRDCAVYHAFRQVPDYAMWISIIQQYEIHVIEKYLIHFTLHTSGKVKNTSAQTVENEKRNSREESYIWYNVIKNLDNEFFIKAFKNKLINPDAKTKEQIICEKFLILMRRKDKLAASFYIYDFFKNKSVEKVMSEEYGFIRRDIHAISCD